MNYVTLPRREHPRASVDDVMRERRERERDACCVQRPASPLRAVLCVLAACAAGRLQRRRQRQHRQQPVYRPGDRRLPDLLCEAHGADRPRRQRWRRTTCASCSDRSIRRRICTCAPAPRRARPKPTSPAASPPARVWDVKDVDTSADGTLVMFAMRGPLDQEPAGARTRPRWRIWQYTIATDTLSAGDQSGRRPGSADGQRRLAALPARRAHRVLQHAPGPVAGRAAQ